MREVNGIEYKRKWIRKTCFLIKSYNYNWLNYEYENYNDKKKLRMSNFLFYKIVFISFM